MVNYNQHNSFFACQGLKTATEEEVEGGCKGENGESQPAQFFLCLSRSENCYRGGGGTVQR